METWQHLFTESPKVMIPSQWEVWMVVQSLLLYQKQQLSDQDMDIFQNQVLTVFDNTILRR